VNDITRILESMEHGDPEAAREVFPLAQAELRHLGVRKMAKEAMRQKPQRTPKGLWDHRQCKPERAGDFVL
jgi:hypothetical protein